MSFPHRAKRAEISGHIYDLEKHATIKLFSPDTNPDSIPPKRAYRRTRHLAHHELSRLTQDALRTASGQLTSAEIAASNSGRSAERVLTCSGGCARAGPWKSTAQAATPYGHLCIGSRV